MAKRGADRQMGKDETEDDSTVTPEGTWAEAPAETLKQRTFVKARRKGDATTPTAASGVVLPAAAAEGKTEEKPTTPAPEKKEEKKEEVKAETKKEETKKEENGDKKAGAAAAAPNAFAKFMLQPGQWECPHCLVKNEKAAAKCAACEIPREGAAPAAGAAAPAAAASGFTFGAPIATSTASSSSSSTTSSSTSSSSDSASGSSLSRGPSFTFGSGSFGSSSFSSGSFSFGSSSSFGSAAAGSSFGFGSGGLSFGSVAAPATGAGFGEAGKELKFEETKRLEAETGVSEVFKDKKAELSGEEGDTVVHKVNAKVYALKTPEKKEDEPKDAPAAAPKFVECGAGELHVNTFTKDGVTKGRLVLRASQTQRLVLNAPIFGEMTHSVEDKFVKFISTGLDGELTSYALRMKNKAEASELDTHITQLIDAAKKK